MWEAVADRFGSKRGLLAYVLGQMALMLGRYRSLQTPDWTRVRRLVFVCHGNICRSALGDAVARTHGARAVSCGLHACPGRPADPRTVAYAARHGIDLAKHESARADQLQFTGEDLIVAMEPAHLVGLADLMGEAQVTLLGLWLPEPLAYLHDPYNASPSYFERCMGLVKCATTRITDYLEKAKQ